MAAFAALLAILLALASLGWSRAAALPVQGTTRLWPPLRRTGQPAAGLIVTSFAFVPQLLPPALMPAVLMVVGLLVGMISIVTQPLLIIPAPVAILAARQATLAAATWWYRRRMHAQILPAVQSLTGLMEGGRTMLVAAFAAVAPTLPEPLGSEWRWVLSRLNLPYTVEQADGKVERYTSTHAYALDQLAAQTPVRLHAQVLDQLVAIYEHQLEAQAHQRLTQIAAALARHASLQRSVTTLWPATPYSRLAAWWRRAPRLVGATGGDIALVGGWWLVEALQLTGTEAMLPMLVATLLALILGIYLPGMPARAFARRRERLLLQTIDLAGYLQFAVESSQGDADLLRTYVRRPQRPIADAQAVVGATLAEIERRRRGNVFALMIEHAVETGSQPLIACCTALFHGAQNSRRALGPVLAQQREQLFDTLVEACKQRAQRLELLLIGISAAALAFGLLPCILYVMTSGGAALGSFL